MLIWTEFQTHDESLAYNAIVDDDVFYHISREDWLWTVDLFMIGADGIIFIGEASSLDQAKALVQNDYENRIAI